MYQTCLPFLLQFYNLCITLILLNEPKSFFIMFGKKICKYLMSAIFLLVLSKCDVYWQQYIVQIICEINVTGWKRESQIIRHKQFNVVILENHTPIYYRENKDGNIMWLCGDGWWYFPGLTALPAYSQLLLLLAGHWRLQTSKTGFNKCLLLSTIIIILLQG